MAILMLWPIQQAAAAVFISEFVADNDGSYVDEDGDAEDWIELYNSGTTAVDLSGWGLTDDSDELSKWVFAPGATLGAGQYLVVFASGKNRREIDQEMHTNFSLKKGGEYLALVQNDGVTVEHAYAAEYPPQFEGMSYGLDQQGGIETVITLGSAGQVGVPTSATDFANNYVNWNSVKDATFSGASWLPATVGVGYERTAGYGIWLGTDLETQMYGNNASLFLRVPFTVSDASIVELLRLNMRWDDGFEAFINGVRVAGDRDADPAQWNSSSTSLRNDNQNEDATTFNLTPGSLGLVDGVNILAIQGFNHGPTSSDMLILPELEIVSTVSTASIEAYQLIPSPGAANVTGISDVPPYFAEVTDAAARPVGGAGSAPILVTAELRETDANVDAVRLYYRVMFGSETQLTMRDDGVGADLVAGDDIYSVNVPTTGLSAGQMIRWRIEAEDDEGRIGLSPRYADPFDGDRYYGTVAINSAHGTSQLTILETFVDDEVAVDTRGGTRASIYYLGDFYDNVQMDLHGQSTANDSFIKKSYDIDFNADNRFNWKDGERRVKDINLLTNWADKSKLRNTLAYELLKACGTAYHFAFPVRVERNGSFYTTADMVEDGDDRYLERIGLDPNGSLYKIYDKLEDANASSKKTRKDEDTSDLAALIAGVDDALTDDARRLYAYDNVNIAGTINYLAALIVSDITDVGHKNFYMYRDTNGSGEWYPLPWDVDYSAGRRWDSTLKSFSDTLHTNRWIWSPNRLWDLMQNTDEFQSMFLRRIRTLREEVLLAPGTPAQDDWYVARVQELVDLIDPNPSNFTIDDADLDYSTWGSWGNNNRVRQAADRILYEWLPGKRSYMFSGGRSHNGESLPPAQPAIPNMTIETIDFLPASGNGEEEYLVLKNHEGDAMDLSGWTLSGAIEYTFPAGTVIAAGNGNFNSDYVGLLHVARNPKAFRARSDAVTGGQYRFVTGGYSGQLSARGELVELRNAQGELVTSKSYVGTPSDAQQYLRVTEVMYNPAVDASVSPDSEDLEFIELRNISDTVTLDLSGVKFTQGVSFDFTGSAVTLLGPGERVVVAANSTAFNAHYGSLSSLAGAFYGSLDNGGETLRLEDAAGEKIQEFRYNDSWQPMTDGLGFSLVIVDDTLAWDNWSQKESWRISGVFDGSPGTSDLPQVFSGILVNEVLAHTDLPLVDSIELYNPTGSSVNVGCWFLTDNLGIPKKYRIPDNTMIPAGGYLVFDEDDFNVGPNAFALSEFGEPTYLLSADGSQQLTGYFHGWDVKASPNGVSSGRYVDSAGDDHFVLQSSITLGAENALPLVGPVVVSEIHYHPLDISAGVDNDLDEFIQLVNISGSSVPLYSTDTSVPGYGNAALNDTWRLRNAVDFDFPAGVSLAAGARLLVVGFDPVVETAQLASLRALYNIPASVPVYGPWSGKLDNSSEQIELKRPGSAESIAPYFVPYYMVEEIDYKDSNPWPVAADGFGPSLQRRDTSTFGNDAINWRAAYPFGAASPDTDGDDMADWWEVVHGLSVGVNDANLDPDADGVSNRDEQVSGTDPQDALSVLKLSILSSPSHAMIEFTAMPDLEYTVQFRDSLNVGNWQIFEQVNAGAAPRDILLTEPFGANRFFRVVTPPVE